MRLQRTVRQLFFSTSLALSLTAFAQDARVLHGTVRDRLGAVVSGARVEVVHHAGTGTTVGTTTVGSDGRYTFSVPATGRYHVRVTANTFGVIDSPDVFVGNAGELLDVTLSPAGVREEITVTATGLPEPIAQTGAPVTVLTEAEYPHSPEVQQLLRLVPGVQMTQNGGTGGASSLFIRGGESNANKVLLDGVPLNDVGGLVNFANIATIGIERIEILRQPDSAMYGSDALAGVVSLTTVRGATSLPILTYAVDGGNLGLRRQEVSGAGARGKLDYYSGFARLDTANNVANNAFHNATISANFGFEPDARTDARFIFRRQVTAGGQPNAFLFYGIPDAAEQKQQDQLLSGTVQHQTTARWHNLVRYGRESLTGESYDFAATGIPYTPTGSKYQNGYIGNQVTITGANGYSVSGQALFQYVGSTPSTYLNNGNRDFVYAQSDYKLNAHLTALGAFKYEAERGVTQYISPYGPSVNTVDRRNQSYTVQVAGDAGTRLFYTLGSGIEKNEVFGSALTPRVSLAYYLVRPRAATLLSGTKLHASFGKGIKESNVAQQNGSLYGVFSSSTVTNGAALIARYGTKPLGAEYSRTYDVGLEQQMGDGRAKINATFFHNEFTNGIQYVSQAALLTLGVSGGSSSQFKYGAYVNSQAFRAMGGELEIEVRLAPGFFARAGYTYLDAVVQHSFSSDAYATAAGKGTFNKSGNFGTIPIGVYAPLDGARPFRRAPHSGYFSVGYAHKNLSALLSGTMVGKRDDSTFLTDKDFGNSLLLPNRNLDGSYQRLELTGDYKVTRRITAYADIQNLLNETYSEAFGYPALPINIRGGLKFTFGGENWRIR